MAPEGPFQSAAWVLINVSAVTLYSFRKRGCLLTLDQDTGLLILLLSDGPTLCSALFIGCPNSRGAGRSASVGRRRATGR